MNLYLTRRFGQLIPTVFGIVTLVFLMLRLLPGDPAVFIAGENVGEEALQALREQLGLTKPLLEQYTDYLTHVSRLDLGKSVVNGLPVLQLLATAIPITLLVGGLSLVLGFLISVPLGTIAAYLASRGRTAMDQALVTTAMVVDVMPSFWVGLLLMLVLTLQLRLLPATGQLEFN